MSVVLAALCSGVVGVLGIPFFNWICLHSIESLFLFTRCSVVLISCMKAVWTLVYTPWIFRNPQYEPRSLRHGHFKLIQLYVPKCLCSKHHIQRRSQQLYSSAARWDLRTSYGTHEKHEAGKHWELGHQPWKSSGDV